MSESKQHWTAENNANYDPPWVILYDRTPGGKKNDDGSTSYSLVIPALHLTEMVAEPEFIAKSIARELNAFDDMLAALRLVGMSAGWQYMAFETRAVIEAALSKATGES